MAALLTLWSAASSCSGSTQGHVVAQRASTADSVSTWFVWSYFDSSGGGLGEVSSLAWIGFLSDSGDGFYLSTQLGRDRTSLLVARDYPSLDLKSGDPLLPTDLVRFAVSNGAEDSPFLLRESLEFIANCPSVIEFSSPDAVSDSGVWTAVSVQRYKLSAPTPGSSRGASDEWKGMPPLDLLPD